MIEDKDLKKIFIESTTNYIFTFEEYELNRNPDCCYVKNKSIKNKRKGNNYAYAEHLTNIYRRFNVYRKIFKEIKINGDNNEEGFIKFVPVQEYNNNSNFLFKAMSNDKDLYIVSITGFSKRCKRVCDMKKEMRIKNIELKFDVFNITEFGNEMTKDSKYSISEFKLNKKIGMEEHKHNRIYCFISISKNDFKAKKLEIPFIISDFFSFVSTKKLYKRNHSIIDFNLMDFMLCKENDIQYYMDSLFKEYNNHYESPRFKEYFLFRLNFYESSKSYSNKRKNEINSINFKERENLTIDYLNKKNKKKNNNAEYKNYTDFIDFLDKNIEKKSNKEELNTYPKTNVFIPFNPLREKGKLDGSFNIDKNLYLQNRLIESQNQVLYNALNTLNNIYQTNKRFNIRKDINDNNDNNNTNNYYNH
ncbi:hypothetical protein BCR36DRAFT_584685 [Piromyces finnis]|uniref:Uncharacterized protein n=1 Tax=Piromyces finnis TaxID=1754191 RepID=A0A1Y1V596_9FUNG|nr:hypothetical protein BCR36DRAFT_584685 [Piromyces finnis]|eukprot:ORX47590.1 hypothetical protein BCR36DRAFT_584685 [Piromyces finnis]